MKTYKINITTGVIALIIAMIAFLLIYRDIKTVPEFKGTFVYCKGDVTL